MASTRDLPDIMIGAGEAARNAEAAAAHVKAAEKAEAAGEKEKAISELRRAVGSDPSNSRLFFKLAYMLDLAGEEDEAIAMYERSCETPPAPVNGLINLAILYEDRGDFGRAERCLRQVLDTNPNHPRARLFMKDILASRDMVVEDDHERDKLKRNAILDTPVTDFELSVRARTCLKKMNIRTLGDLLRTTEAELMGYKNFGESSLVEIKQMLQAKGLRLGQGVEDAHRAARRRIIEQLKGSGNEAVLAKPVSDLNLSVRARKALQLLSIHSLGDLVSHTEAELMGVKNFGATSLTEVKQRLGELNLSLRTLDE
jgi:DNA-directed RNA polymerase subunit alpha